MTTTVTCELCGQPGGEIIFQHDKYRVVLVDDASYPGFCRVIWNAHVKEMTDLEVADRSLMMQTVCKVESVLREVMQPEKINLASLGNVVPHLHWHVIPRYTDDAHFPAPVWAQAQRAASASVIEARVALLPLLRTALARQLGIPAN